MLAYLIFCDLHVQDDIVDEFREGFFDRALKLVVVQKRVDEFEDAEDQIFKAKNFSCTGWMSFMMFSKLSINTRSRKLENLVSHLVA